MVALLLAPLFIQAQEEQEEKKRDQWFDIGIGFQGVDYRVFDNLVSFEDMGKRIFVRAGYKYWLGERIGIGFDFTFGDLYADLPNSSFDLHEQLFDGTFLLHYKFTKNEKFNIFGSTGFAVTSFNQIGNGYGIPSTGSQASIPFQLGATYGLSEKADFVFLASFKKPISDLPSYLQYSFGFSFNLNRDKKEKEKAKEEEPAEEAISENAGLSQSIDEIVEEKLKSLDTDNDGVPNINDGCPNVAGPLSNGGCPEVKDSDGDGVSDERDRCPNQAGTSAQGCPVEAAREVSRTAQTDLLALMLSMSNITFEAGKSDLSEDMERILNELAQVMKADASVSVEIMGHADATGESAGNMALSRARANAVKQYLISKGISDSRLATKHFGDKQPVGNNQNAIGRSKNRRVEIRQQR